MLLHALREEPSSNREALQDKPLPLCTLRQEPSSNAARLFRANPNSAQTHTWNMESLLIESRGTYILQ